MKTLLAIDGGGLYGVGVANWIPKLGDWKFDYYAGTSVGSALAACYALGMDATQVKDLFNGDLPKRIFVKPKFPLCFNPLRPATYDNRGLKEVLYEIFGDKKVKDTIRPLVIVAWNYVKRKEKVFTYTFNSKYYLRDAILASMSAPTFFPIVNINGQLLGDGGVCGNDPSLAGLSAMRDDGIRTRNIKCLSINTCGTPRPLKLNVTTKLGWLPILIDAATMGNVSYTSYGVRHILEDKRRYLRISPDTLPYGPVDDLNAIPAITKAWSEWDHTEAVAFLKRWWPQFPGRRAEDEEDGAEIPERERINSNEVHLRTPPAH